jgi:hypothetical protein
MTGTERTLPDDERFPTEHGKPVSEVVDLGGPVARIVRTTYVGSRWTRLVLMIPTDHQHQQPGGSVEVALNDRDLARLLEALAWPK